jgi:putative redox protein
VVPVERELVRYVDRLRFSEQTDTGLKWGIGNVKTLRKMKKDLKVIWTGDMTFVASNSSGHEVTVKDNREDGLTPMQLLLLGAGACASIDVVMILQKARQDITDVRVEVGGERREEMPRVYTDVEMHFIVEGRGVKEQHVKRAIDLAMEKYCSASAQLAALADIRTRYQIIEVG